MLIQAILQVLQQVIGLRKKVEEETSSFIILVSNPKGLGLKLLWQIGRFPESRLL